MKTVAVVEKVGCRTRFIEIPWYEMYRNSVQLSQDDCDLLDRFTEKQWVDMMQHHFYNWVANTTKITLKMSVDKYREYMLMHDRWTLIQSFVPYWRPNVHLAVTS